MFHQVFGGTEIEPWVNCALRSEGASAKREGSGVTDIRVLYSRILDLMVSILQKLMVVFVRTNDTE